MSDAYLWDKSGPPDPEIERLERLLGRFSSVPAMPPLASPTVRWRSLRTLAPMLATAAAVIVMVAIASRSKQAVSPANGAWTVASVTGQPRIGRDAVAGDARLGVGESLVTDPSSRARLEVGAIGEVTIEPNTRVRLLAARDDRHRLALDRGTVRAFIVAPPGQFIVDTRSATAVDLGCVYTLNVDEGGTGLLSVEVGWVAFEMNGRESFVPGGASCPTRARVGPGTPRFNDTEPAIKAALDTLDFGTRGMERPAALRLVLERARPRDALTLWHLLARVEPSERGAVYDAFAARVPPPQGVTRDAVLRLDRAALDLWWDALNLYDATFWRTWKGNLFGKSPAGR